jgi:hypothetical protein
MGRLEAPDCSCGCEMGLIHRARQCRRNADYVPVPETPWWAEEGDVWLLFGGTMPDVGSLLRGGALGANLAADVSGAVDAAAGAAGAILAVNPRSITLANTVAIDTDRLLNEDTEPVGAYEFILEPFYVRIARWKDGEGTSRSLNKIAEDAGRAMLQQAGHTWLRDFAVTVSDPEFEVIRTEWDNEHEFIDPAVGSAGRLIVYANLVTGRCECMGCRKRRRRQLADTKW